MVPTPTVTHNHRDLNKDTHSINPTSLDKSWRKDTSETDGVSESNFYHHPPSSLTFYFLGPAHFISMCYS